MRRLLQIALCSTLLAAAVRPATAADAAPAPRAPAPGRAPAPDDGEGRVRALEARLEELRDRVLRTRSRLQRLEETVAADADARQGDARPRAPRAGERGAPAAGGAAR